MPTQVKLDKFFNKAINQLFLSVGFKNFDPQFAKQENWFQKRSWDEKTREEFKAWFFQEAKKDLRWNKRLCQKEFSHFDFMYGWKILDPKEEKARWEKINKALGKELVLD